MHASRLRSALCSRRELTMLAEAQQARDEMQAFRGWPMCGICMRPVRAYGLGAETDYAITLWARCNHGMGGRDVFAEKVIRKPSKSIREQGAGNWLGNMIKMAVFFV